MSAAGLISTYSGQGFLLRFIKSSGDKKKFRKIEKDLHSKQTLGVYPDKRMLQSPAQQADMLFSAVRNSSRHQPDKECV